MSHAHARRNPPERSPQSPRERLARHLASAPSSADVRLHVDTPAAGPTPMSGPRIRMCVLCGEPLRAGQHILRIHGTTVHARCTRSTG